MKTKETNQACEGLSDRVNRRIAPARGWRGFWAAVVVLSISCWNLAARAQSAAIYAGTYAGSYSGGSSGTWDVTVSTTGSVTGYRNDIHVGYAAGTGSVGVTGSIVDGFLGGTTFNGQIDASGNVTGTWVDSGSGRSGSFVGSRTSSAFPWVDATTLAGGWESSGWFGVFNIDYYPWIYHDQHGWMYVFGTDPASIWLYNSSDTMGFLWTSSTVYPWLWDNTQQTWMYYSVGSSNPRYFFNWNTQTWQQFNP